MLQFPRTILAVTPGLPLPRLPFPVDFAHMAYRIGPNLQLLRARPELELEGGLLMLSGTASCCRGNFDRFCEQLLSECHIRHMVGVVANWELSSQYASLVSELDRALAVENLEFWVPEYFSKDVTAGHIMISSQLSGGTLAARLQEAVQQWGKRVALAIECTPWDFLLPCAPGQERPLEENQAQQLMSKHATRFWFSEALFAQYFTYQAESKLHLVQFDNAYSIRKKLELSKQFGLSGAMLSWDEIHRFSREIFSSPQKRSGGNAF